MEDKEPQRDLLRKFAASYMWWKTPDEAMQYPDRVVAQVMNISDWHDVGLVLEHFDQSHLRQVLRHAEAGQFNARSWHWWHYRLGLASVGEVPSLPGRKTA